MNIRLLTGLPLVVVARHLREYLTALHADVDGLARWLGHVPLLFAVVRLRIHGL